METATTHPDMAAACGDCGGGLSAAHMLTHTYELDASGGWTRWLAEFAEDVVVVCRSCGAEQAGHIAEDGVRFTFAPDVQAAGRPATAEEEQRG